MALTPLVSAGLDLCPTQEMRDSSWFGTSSSWDQPCLSRLRAELELPPPHMPEGRLVRAAQVSVQPDRRNYCDKGKGKAARAQGFSFTLAEPGLTWLCWHRQARRWTVPEATHGVPYCTRTAPSDRSTAQRGGEGVCSSTVLLDNRQGRERRDTRGVSSLNTAHAQSQQVLTVRGFSASLTSIRVRGSAPLPWNPEAILESVLAHLERATMEL